MRLMTKDFETFFIQKMTKFGKDMSYQSEHLFWDRLKGSNPFCAKDFKPEEQAIRSDKRGPRYAQLNFCYGLHGTLECRLFHGTADPKEIQSCINIFVEIVEEFLERSEVKTKSLEKTYEIYDSDLEKIKINTYDPTMALGELIATFH